MILLSNRVYFWGESHSNWVGNTSISASKVHPSVLEIQADRGCREDKKDCLKCPAYHSMFPTQNRSQTDEHFMRDT